MRNLQHETGFYSVHTRQVCIGRRKLRPTIKDYFASKRRRKKEVIILSEALILQSCFKDSSKQNLTEQNVLAIRLTIYLTAFVVSPKDGNALWITHLQGHQKLVKCINSDHQNHLSLNVRTTKLTHTTEKYLKPLRKWKLTYKTKLAIVFIFLLGLKKIVAIWGNSKSTGLCQCGITTYDFWKIAKNKARGSKCILNKRNNRKKKDLKKQLNSLLISLQSS